MKFTAFKTRKNATYSYTPRYYDERKEYLDKMKKKHNYDEINEESKNVDSDFQKVVNYRDEWRKNRTSTSSLNYRIRFYVILIFLFLMTYVALKYLDIKFI